MAVDLHLLRRFAHLGGRKLGDLVLDRFAIALKKPHHGYRTLARYGTFICVQIWASPFASYVLERIQAHVVRCCDSGSTVGSIVVAVLSCFVGEEGFCPGLTVAVEDDACVDETADEQEAVRLKINGSAGLCFCVAVLLPLLCTLRKIRIGIGKCRNVQFYHDCYDARCECRLFRALRGVLSDWVRLSVGYTGNEDNKPGSSLDGFEDEKSDGLQLPLGEEDDRG